MPAIARWCYHHRRLVVLLWIVVLVVLGAANASIGSKFSDDFKLPDTESKKALDLLTANAPQKSGETAQIVVHAKQGTLDDAETRERVTKMFADVKAVPHVLTVGDIYTTDVAQVSPDRKTGFVEIQLDKQGQDLKLPEIKKIVTTAQAANSDALQVELGGPIIQYVNSEEPASTEFLGVLAAAIILFIAFGSIYTMLLPIASALLALGIGMSLIGFLTHAFSVAEFGPVLAALIGLGVGVDYALFIVSRHRANLLQGHTPEESIITAVDTSGRAVVFAGITVCIGILGLLLIGVSFLYGVALSVVVVVLLTMLAAITFLPAMLGFVGMKALTRKSRRSLQAGELIHDENELSPNWFRWAGFVNRHSISLGALALVVLLAIGAPFLSMRLGTTDSGGDPKDSTTRKAYDLLADAFGPGFNGPLQLVAQVKGDDGLAQFNQLIDQVKNEPNVASATPATLIPNTDVAMALVYPESKPQAEETTELINHLRSDVIKPYEQSHPIDVSIGGATAIFQDFSDVLTSKLPLFIGVVVGLAFILLMAVFRSLLVPLVASAMNLLSTAAAFGVVVAIFQWGWGADLIGVQQTGPILAFLPIMAFAILFGLSMDYEVFLVSRMYEEWHKRRDNNQAITLGQAETGRAITAAAAIMICVFASFVFGGDATIKLFGTALASAVLFDALIVRTILVPAVMHIIGPANWYLPKWLDRILPTLNVEPKPVATVAESPVKD